MASTSTTHAVVPVASASSSRALTWQTVALVLLTVALWAGNPVATRYSTDALPPITVAGLRFLLATLVMVAWCLIERVSFRLQWEQLPAVLIAGVLLFAQISLFTIGTQWTSTSHASLFVNTLVFLVFAGVFDENSFCRTKLTLARRAGR